MKSQQLSCGNVLSLCAIWLVHQIEPSTRRRTTTFPTDVTRLSPLTHRFQGESLGTCKATVPDPKLEDDRKLSLGTRLYALIASCCLSGMTVWVRIHYLCYPHTLCNEQPLNARWRHCCYDNVYYTHCLPNLQTSWRQMRLGSQQLCTPLSPEALFINKVCGLLMRNHSRLMTFQLDL